jgi:hypothetical protein
MLSPPTCARPAGALHQNQKHGGLQAGLVGNGFAPPCRSWLASEGLKDATVIRLKRVIENTFAGKPAPAGWMVVSDVAFAENPLILPLLCFGFRSAAPIPKPVGVFRPQIPGKKKPAIMLAWVFSE